MLTGLGFQATGKLSSLLVSTSDTISAVGEELTCSRWPKLAVYGTLLCCREIATKYDLTLLCTVKMHVPPSFTLQPLPLPPPPPVH